MTKLNKTIIVSIFALIVFLAGALLKQNHAISKRNTSIDDLKKQVAYLDNELCKMYDKEVKMEVRISELEEGQRVDDDSLNTNYYLSTNGLVRTGMNAAEIALVLGTRLSFSHPQPQIIYPGETNHVSSYMLGWDICKTKEKNICPFETCFIFFDKAHPTDKSPGPPIAGEYIDSQWIAKSISLKFRKEKQDPAILPAIFLEQPEPLKTLLRTSNRPEDGEMSAYNEELVRVRNSLDVKVVHQILAWISDSGHAVMGGMILEDIFWGTQSDGPRPFTPGSPAALDAASLLVESMTVSGTQYALQTTLLHFLRLADIPKIELTIPEYNIEILIEVLPNGGNRMGLNGGIGTSPPFDIEWRNKIVSVSSICQRWCREELIKQRSKTEQDKASINSKR